MTAYERCSQTCAAGRQEALRALKHCLNKGGRFSDSRLVLRLSETMRLCQLCADFCASFTDDAVAPCASCAEECNAAADLLDSLKDPELDRCADGLRRCAAACLQTIGEAGRLVTPSSHVPDPAAIETARPLE